MQMIGYCIAFFTVMILPVLAGGEISLEIVIAGGSGSTQQSARRAALVSAIEQVNGIEVSATGTITTRSNDAVEKINDALRTIASTSDLTSEKVSTATHGIIYRFSIREEKTAPDGRWKSELEVAVAQYRPPGSDRSHLRSIAVLPFRARAPLPGNVRDRWEQKLVTQFVQSRRFRVLDRQFTPELKGEKGRLRAGAVPVDELVKIGQELGADYLIAGEITTLDLKSDGTENSVSEIEGVIEYRVLELAPGEVRWANTMNAFLSRDALRRLGLQGNRNQSQEHLLNSLADSVVTEVVDCIYPIKVLKVEDDGNVLLNQGGTRVQLGQWYSISHGGSEAVDPDNGLHIRLDGRELAIGRVTNIREKYSEIKIEQGTPGLLKVGMPCRRLSRDRLLAMERQAQEQQVARQNELIRDGKCPPMIVKAFRTSSGWNLVVKNQSVNPVTLNALTKHIAGTREHSAFSLILRGGGEESFGISYPFTTGDMLELKSDAFEEPFLVLFP
jgi:TolB-like protein